jgi:hypothetical protein
MKRRIPFLMVPLLLLAGISCGRLSQPGGPVETTPQVVEMNLSTFRPFRELHT